MMFLSLITKQSSVKLRYFMRSLGGRSSFKVLVDSSAQGLQVPRNLQMMLISRFCIFQKRNRELSNASVCEGKPDKSRYTKFYCGQWCDRGISYYKSVKGAGTKAKTVTNLLILLSVLGGRSNYFVLVIVCILGNCHKFFIYLLAIIFSNLVLLIG
jgi:hypothetical protein